MAGGGDSGASLVQRRGRRGYARFEKNGWSTAPLAAIGLPLTMLLSFGVLLFLATHFSLFTVAVLATMLAPTDAALGKAVNTNEAVRERIRQGLNVDNGLNDGICVSLLPVLLVFLELGLDTAEHSGAWTPELKLVVEEIGIRFAVGPILTYFAVRLMRAARHRNWLTPTWI